MAAYLREPVDDVSFVARRRPALDVGRSASAMVGLASRHRWAPHDRPHRGRGARREAGAMDEHLPQIYRTFRESYPDVAIALDELAAQADRAGPLDEGTQRLVKLGMAIAAESPGAVRSNVRKALDAGHSAEEVRHVAVLAITTCGFPTAVAGTEWIEQVLAGRQ